MAVSRARLSLSALALAGALAFTGCGGSDQVAADASASQQINDEAKNKIPDFVNEFYTAMRSGSAQDLSDESVEALNKVQSDEASSADDVAQAIDEGLSDEEKQQLLNDMKDGADPLYKLVDHEGLSDAQSIMLSMVMISSNESLSAMTFGVDEDQLKVSVDLDQVKFDGDKASVPSSAVSTGLSESAQASASATPSEDADEDETGSLPLVWDGSQWKVDGEAYYDFIAA